MRVLVTGASGFIGSALCRLLAGRGDRVRALVRPTSRTEGLRALGVELVPGDLAEPASLSAAVDGCEAVVHLAGLVKALSDRELFRANAEGTGRLARACAAAARPPLLVYVSSLAAAGPSRPGRPRTEDDPPAPVSRYGESKLAGERAVRDLAGRLPASIVRPPIVYGPGDRELVGRLAGMARAGWVVRSGPASKRYSVVHVDDLCRGILAVLERGRRLGPEGPEGTYFLDDGAEHGWDEIGQAACAAWGRPRARVLALPEAAGALAAAGAELWAALTRRASVLSLDKLKEIRQPAWTCSSARAAAELGWSARLDLAAGMRDAMAWARQEG